MFSPFVILFAFGLFVLNLTDEVKKEDRKVALKRTPNANASYYWPFDNFTRKMKKVWMEELKKGNTETILRNGDRAKAVNAGQIGSAIHLDGDKQWIDIKLKEGEEDCFRLNCPFGISVGFWIKFYSGDYILAAGGYARWKKRSDEESGFRIQRDKKTNYHTLEVANGIKKWQIYIEPFPTNKWVYLSFSWREDTGLKLYFDGELTFTSNKPINLFSSPNSGKRGGLSLMHIGKKDIRQEFNNSGKFQIAHFAVWFWELPEKKIYDAFKAHVVMRKVDKMCCYQHFAKTYCNQEKRKECICPDLETKKQVCNESVVHIPAGCGDALGHCSTLISNQDYCSTKNYQFSNMCRKSCEKCGFAASKRTGPLQHFSEKTLIFALLGCVGGLVVLFGVTVYFWKVYRTRCYPSETKGREFLM